MLYILGDDITQTGEYLESGLKNNSNTLQQGEEKTVDVQQERPEQAVPIVAIQGSTPQDVDLGVAGKLQPYSTPNLLDQEAPSVFLLLLLSQKYNRQEQEQKQHNQQEQDENHQQETDEQTNPIARAPEFVPEADIYITPTA